jgi:hypothetical protein
MAADNSPPRIQPIVITAFIAVLTLVGLKFVFDSYYLAMFEAEQYRKIGSVEPTQLLALHAAEKKSLASAPVPIDRAIELVVKDRADPMSNPKAGDITPRPSTDTAALIGWASLGRVAPPGPAGATSADPSPGGAAPAATGPAPSGSAAGASSAAVPPAPSAAPSAASPGAPRSPAPPVAPTPSAPSGTH